MICIMSNLYHILDKVPALEADEMQVEYEELAQDLFNSGLVRIDADDQSNFIKFTDPSLRDSFFCTEKELKDHKLVKGTKEIIANTYAKRYAGKALENKVIEIFDKLLSLTKKLIVPTKQLQIKLIRLLVQSTHPIVLRWILLDRVPIFLSYGHSIGDVMDIKNWKHSGSNSGMQSTDGINATIFVSIGGDPFRERYNKEYGDGFPSIARLLVVAGQELGHYSDIMRDNNGRQIGRHSANFACTRATQKTLIGRREDLKNCDKLLSTLNKMGLNKVIEHDRNISFYDRNKLLHLHYIYNVVVRFIYKSILARQARKQGFIFVLRYSKDKYMGLTIKAMIKDMMFNLAPVADVYARDNKEEEEAISCIEALARVPQQVNKWGHLSTKATMKHLYTIYYKDVIPDLIEKYEIVTGKKYRRSLVKKQITCWQKILNYFRRTKANEHRIIE